MNVSVIETKNLSYHYPDGTCALKDINIKIKKGEKVAFIGSNGAGKTTLFLNFNGILKPSSGNVVVTGITLKNDRDILRNIRQKVGLVFQNPDDQLFAPTVVEDVAFGPMNIGLPRDEVDRQVREALRKVGMEGFEKKAPHHLSHGQKKKVAIAGIIAMEPEIIVFDEPTAYMDPLGVVDMLRIIHDLNKDLGVTTIMSSHDVDFIPLFANKVYVMHDGQIIGEGSPEEIFSRKAVIKKAHLRLPHVAHLLYLLKKESVPVEVKLTVKEARDELLRLLG
ncbi:MAG: ATP-binding cassette domain-containing protein [Methanobacterium sp.]|jgi:cobalt/nickel transport system ATP-binding protein